MSRVFTLAILVARPAERRVRPAAPPALTLVASLAATPDRPEHYGLEDTVFGRIVDWIADDCVGLRRPDGSLGFLPLADPPPEEDRSASRALLVRYLAEPEAVAHLGRVVPHRGPDGAFDGYRVFAIRPGTLLEQLGLRNGDLVHTVDGRPLTSIDEVLETRSRFCLDLTRDGGPRRLCYDLR